MQIDTKNILFICGGAFVGLEDQVAHRLSTSSIGFGNPVRYFSNFVQAYFEFLRNSIAASCVENFWEKCIGRSGVQLTHFELAESFRAYCPACLVKKVCMTIFCQQKFQMSFRVYETL